jgi:hypothetical protein
MKSAPLRGAQGLRPYARSNPRAASRLALAGYPLAEIGHDFQRTAKVTACRAHHKLEHVTPGATAQTLEDLFIGLDEK